MINASELRAGPGLRVGSAHGRAMVTSERFINVPADGRLCVDDLRRLAVQFDEISAETDYRAVASEFMDWLIAATA